VKRLTVRNWLAALVLSLPFSDAACDPVTSITWLRQDLYNDGQKAYKEMDFVTALKDLFAFETLNEKQLQDSASDTVKDFRVRLTQVISESEIRLRSNLQNVGATPQQKTWSKAQGTPTPATAKGTPTPR
jgi:hypothetical protein